MSLSHKNIIITPNTGEVADPSIVFTASTASVAGKSISLNAYPENNITLSFEGSSGQLFSISDNMAGTIYRVNDVSGIPSIEVIDDGTIKLAEFGGNVGIGISNPTERLDVSGNIKATSFIGNFIGNADTVTNGVYTTGNQTIGGTKTFSAAVVLSTAGTATTHAVRADRSVSAGNGLTGGGNLTADRSITLGTPSNLSATTTNNVTAESHTHSIITEGAGSDVIMRQRGRQTNNTDANTFIESGVYGLNASHTNGPTQSYDVLIVGRNADTGGQLLLTRDTNRKPAMRGWSSSGSSFTAWRYFLMDGESGNGSGLTNLNASNLTSGAVPDARISGSYTGLVNLTGSGTVDFAKFLGNASDTAAAPSYSWTGDTNSGIWWPGADQIGFSTGGTNRLTITTALITSTLNITAPTFNGSLNGNASTATTLSTARTINGTSFDGSSNITTSSWGTARVIRIGPTGKLVNGSGNVSWTLDEIGAPSTTGSGASGTWAISVTGNAATATTLQTARTINGVTFDGSADITVADNTKLPLSGGVMAGSIEYQNISTGGWARGIFGKTQSDNTVRAGMGVLGNGDSITNVYMGMGASPWSTGNGVRITSSGISMTGTVTGFTGNVAGNASTATTLQTARTINGTSFNGAANITTANWGTARNVTIGNTTKSVNGSSNVTWSLAEIGAATSTPTLVTSNITLSINADYHISGSRTLALPAGSPAGSKIRLTKELGNIVTINRSGSETIKYSGGTDTQVIFDIDSEIVFVRNASSQWEI